MSGGRWGVVVGLGLGLAVGGGVWGQAAVGAGVEPDIRRDAVVRAVEEVLPAVVNIGTRTRMQRRGYYYDWWRDNWAPFVQEMPAQESAGSGMIIDEAGYVLTNAHVVEDADEIWVRVADGSEPVRAVALVGARGSDLAVLRLVAEPGRRFKPVRFGAPDDLLLGETVLAVGNPFGLGGSVSRGILSSKSRRTEAGRAMEVWDWLQTDAAINPGNSGGPLVNMRGEVIGVNVAIYKQGQGIGFAIPSKRVMEVLSEIFTPERLKGLWFGARVRGVAGGVEVISVDAAGPSAAGGLRVGDRVSAVNGNGVGSVIRFNQMVADAGEGGVQLAVIRGGRSTRVAVEPVSLAEAIRRRLGLGVREVTGEVARVAGFEEGSGLWVSEVEEGGPSGEAGVERGWLWTGLGGVEVRDLAGGFEAIRGLGRGETAIWEGVARVRRGALVVGVGKQVRVRVR